MPSSPLCSDQDLDNPRCPKPQSSPLISIVLITAGVLVLLILIVGFVLWRVLVLQSPLRLLQQQIKLVPQGPDTVIVFTDIQDSTRLANDCTEPYAHALDIHNELIRAAIKKHNAFEVKTQGDSFMIAFHDPESAVECCFQIQQALLETDWPAPLLDLPSCREERTEVPKTLLPPQREATCSPMRPLQGYTAAPCAWFCGAACGAVQYALSQSTAGGGVLRGRRSRGVSVHMCHQGEWKRCAFVGIFRCCCFFTEQRGRAWYIHGSLCDS